MFDQLGPYRIEKQIGRGGMGSVYAGVNEETGERAAIKVLSPAFADDPGFRSRFLTEIETLKQLRHKNIVRLRGDGEQDGQLFYVMELVEGRSLQEELQAGHKYDWKETAEIAIQICQALKHAHDNGVIHRDLKPANLLRSPEDLIKLTDFGIAKLFGGMQLTAAGSVVGTADFMSPEQAEGLGVTYRSDLYSLGAVMFTLLARRPPFGGASLPQVVHNLRFEAAPSVRRFAPKVPAELEQIIDQLLCKDPEDRVATPLVLANQLRAMKHGLANRNTTGATDSGSDFVKSSVVPTPSDDQVTRVANSSLGQNTELSLTSVDDFDLRAVGKSDSQLASWNNATLATGEIVSEDAASRDSNLSDGAGASHQTIVEAPQLVNRFTTVEADADLKRQEAIDKSAGRREVIKVAAMIIALVGVLAAATWALIPKADGIHETIVALREKGVSDDERELLRQIDRFLDRFPRDPRANEVKGYQLDILSEWHYSRLRVRSNSNALLPVEEQYCQAMLLRESDPDEAVEIFDNLIQDYASEAAGSEEAQLCREFALHQKSLLAGETDVQPRTSP
jgi:serine/threonine-protein kinase